MKRLVFLTLFVLCSENVHSSGSNDTEVTLQDVDEPIQKTQFIDLNADCQWLIFENLCAADLYSISKTTKHCSSLAEDLLGRRLSKKMVIIKMNIPPEESDDFEETNEYVLVNNPLIAAEILEKFGGSIENLKIERFLKRENPHQKLLLFKLILDHCAESLTQLHINWVVENFFDFVTTPFKNVQTVSLDGEVAGLGNDQLNFQRMFPSLRSLQLNYVRNENITALEVEFPHLEHFQAIISRMESPGYVNASVVKMMIRMNPHIRSISMTHVDTSMVQFVSNHLPKLEKLAIVNIFEEIFIPIHFEHVKSVKFDNYYVKSVPSNIIFAENLEEFESSTFLRDHRYIDFIENHKDLKKIRIVGDKSDKGLDDNDIQRLASADLSVIEMSIICQSGTKAEKLLELVENCKELQRLHVNMYALPAYIEGVVLVLIERLQNEWALKWKENNIFIVRKV